LGIYSAIALVVSNMVGTGIFTSTGFLAGDLGDPKLVLIIWLVGAVVALVGAFCYSELGVNFPASGGEYVYLTRAYGPTLGFMSGWVSFFAAMAAAEAQAKSAARHRDVLKRSGKIKNYPPPAPCGRSMFVGCQLRPLERR